MIRHSFHQIDSLLQAFTPRKLHSEGAWKGSTGEFNWDKTTPIFVEGCMILQVASAESQSKSVTLTKNNKQQGN